MTTQTLTLADFLLARIAEDEAGEIQTETVLDGYLGGKRKTLIRHTRVEPSPRWLVECEAKRQIVEAADEATSLDIQVDSEFRVGERDTAAEPYLGDQILRALALPYADHPDFRAEWAL